MARYYIQFDTMRQYRSISPEWGMEELLKLLSNAAEFQQISLVRGHCPNWTMLE